VRLKSERLIWPCGKQTQAQWKILIPQAASAAFCVKVSEVNGDD